MSHSTDRLSPSSPSCRTDADPVQLVIFDCDGVLVDTEPISAEVSAALLSRLGWHIGTQEVLDRFLGCTTEYFEAAVRAHVGCGLPPGWYTDLEVLSEAAFSDRLTPVAGVVQLLDALAADGVATCVASNGSHAKMRHTLGLTGLSDRFTGRLFSADDVDRGKPAPDLYQHTARVMGVPPGACVVLEDSPRGVQAARAAGMACIGFAGLTPPARLAAPGVTVCASMAEVLEELRDNLSIPSASAAGRAGAESAGASLAELPESRG